MELPSYGFGLSRGASTPIPPPPKARLCHIVQWPQTYGLSYGFTYFQERVEVDEQEAGIEYENHYYVNTVSEGSPADYAGLRKGDRIIEIDHSNIRIEDPVRVNHRFKQLDGNITLLVVDYHADRYFKRNKIQVSSTMPVAEVLCYRNPTVKPKNGYKPAELIPVPWESIVPPKIRSSPANNPMSLTDVGFHWNLF